MGDSQGTDVTVVIVPRSRFSATQQNLESLLSSTPVDFRLVYVDAGSPRGTRDYLHQKLASRPGTTLLRLESYLTPNRARTLALEHVATPYVAIADNDVHFHEGWLERLLECLVEEAADAVVPLLTIGESDSQTVHVTDGSCRVQVDGLGRRSFLYSQHREWERADEIAATLERSPTELVEHHCVLMRTDVASRYRRLDPNSNNMWNNQELSLELQQAGCRVFFEPEAMVTFLWGGRHMLQPGDLPYWYLTWSPQWMRAQLRKVNRRYALDDRYDTKGVYGWAGDHRRGHLTHTLARVRRRFERAHLGRVGHALEKSVKIAETGLAWMAVEGLRWAPRARELPVPSAIGGFGRWAARGLSVAGRAREGHVEGLGLSPQSVT